MKRPKRKMSPGVSRARRPKTGNNKGMLILLSEEEKTNIEKAARKQGLSVPQFVTRVARSLGRELKTSKIKRSGTTSPKKTKPPRRKPKSS